MTQTHAYQRNMHIKYCADANVEIEDNASPILAKELRKSWSACSCLGPYACSGDARSGTKTANDA